MPLAIHDVQNNYNIVFDFYNRSIKFYVLETNWSFISYLRVN